jgi:hypothetical protein
MSSYTRGIRSPPVLCVAQTQAADVGDFLFSLLCPRLLDQPTQHTNPGWDNVTGLGTPGASFFGL